MWGQLQLAVSPTWGALVTKRGTWGEVGGPTWESCLAAMSVVLLLPKIPETDETKFAKTSLLFFITIKLFKSRVSAPNNELRTAQCTAAQFNKLLVSTQKN